jgi:feruloyl-CoA synthase
MRAVLAEEPPSMETRELTDKGSINQSVVLKNRAAIVSELYKNPAPAHILMIREEKSWAV